MRKAWAFVVGAAAGAFLGVLLGFLVYPMVMNQAPTQQR